MGNFGGVASVVEQARRVGDRATGVLRRLGTAVDQRRRGVDAAAPAAAARPVPPPFRPAPGRTPEELRAEIAQRTWFHTFDLGDGVRTPGYEDTPAKVEHFQLPERLDGKRVLDIGAYDGFFSFECERRGAAEVMAVDRFTWEWPGADARRNFTWMREVLGSKVDDRIVSVEDLSVDTVGGPYDVVLFLGVLYHAPEPLTYLRRVRSVTAPGGLAIVETVVDLLDIGVPAAAYYPGDSLNGDGSNFWGPNPAAVEGLLRDAGFASVTQFEPWTSNTTWALEAADPAAASPSRRLRRGFAQQPRSGRMVFHARA